MSLILDLPLYPIVKKLSDAIAVPPNINNSDNAMRFKRDADDVEMTTLRDMATTMSATESLLNVVTSIPLQEEPKVEAVVSKHLKNLLEENAATKAIRFWLRMGVDGFYLKGLEHFVNEVNFVDALKYWKSMLGEGRILMCNVKTLMAASGAAKNAILNRIDLVDVTLGISNGTRDIKKQIEEVTDGVLFHKQGRPWVHWSTGSVDTARVASRLQVNNASVAVAMMEMMLPGTPSIFYGDEVMYCQIIMCLVTLV